MNHLESEVIQRTNNNNSFYNKRNDFYTIFDDKKTLNILADPASLEKKLAHNGNVLKSRPSLIEYSKGNRERTPLKPNILPTTSSTYGAYFSYNNAEGVNKNYLNTNRIFY